MRTRGKTKVDTTDYSKDGMDPRDLLDDGENTNGYADDKIEDIATSRTDSRNARNTGNRRPGRLPKAGTAKNRNEKLMESAEFREVVQGFFDFIEEINKSRPPKKPSKKPGKVKNGETRTYKEIGEPDIVKKPKTEMLKPLSNDKPDIQSPSPSETSKLYKFKEDLGTGKGLMDLIKDKDQAHPSSYVQAGGQDPKGHFTEQARKEAQVNKPGYQGNMMDFGHFDPNSLKYQNLQELNNNLMFNKNKAVPASNPYEYNTGMFKDIMQRMQMQSYGEQNPMRNYGMPFDYGGGYHKMGLESFGVKPSAAEMMNLQMIEALLQKNQPNILGSLFGNSQALFGDLPREFPYNMVQNMGGHQRYGNQSLGVELIQSDPEAINPKVYEGKLGRASTHVAIAYFIHFKSLDPETIAKSDKSKVDPTYNARMLKEKKYETYPGEQSLASKLLPQGLESRLAGLGLDSNFPLEYLGAQNIQKLLATQGLSDHHLRELQLQRLQQEQAQALRNEEIARRNLINKNNEIKLEEERAEQQRRQTERANRPPSKPSVIKEDEIIEIKENSDGDVEEVKEEIPQEKVEVKDEVKSEHEKKPVNPNQMQIEGEAGPISAEDIVEEITELTSSSNYDPKKGGKRGKTTLNKPVKKPSEEAGRPEPKANAMVEEIEATGQNGGHNGAGEGEAKQGIQVISDDEEASKMQVEPAPETQIEEEPAANPPQ